MHCRLFPRPAPRVSQPQCLGEVKCDDCYLLLINRILPSFGQGGSQKMIFESVVLAGPWLYNLIGIGPSNFLVQSRSILCHLVWETNLSAWSASGCKEHASTRSIIRHIGPSI